MITIAARCVNNELTAGTGKCRQGAELWCSRTKFRSRAQAMLVARTRAQAPGRGSAEQGGLERLRHRGGEHLGRAVGDEDVVLDPDAAEREPPLDRAPVDAVG